MAETVEIKAGDTEPLWTDYVLNGALLSGATVTLVIYRTSDGFQYNFSTSTFVTAGTGTTQAVTETRTGHYEYAWNTGAVTNPAASDSYLWRFDDVPNARVGIQGGEVRVREIAAILAQVDVKTSTRAAPGDPANALLTGTAGGGSTNTITLTGGSAVDNYYTRCFVYITAGTGANQRPTTILAYNGTTKVATVGPNWSTPPDNTSVFAVIADVQPLIATSGVLQAAASTTATLASTANSVDGFYVDAMLVIRSGTGPGQERIITAYNGTTKVATIDAAWTTTPDATSTYEILPLGRVAAVSVGDKSGYSLANASITSATFAANAIDANAFAQGAADKAWQTTARTLSAGAITSTTFASGAITAAVFAANALGAVWDELAASHTTANTFGAYLGALTPASIATGVWQTAVPGSFTSGQAGNVLGNLPSATALATQVWSTTLPGAFGLNSAGAIIGNRIDVALSSLLSLESGIPAAVWGVGLGGFSAGTTGALLQTNLDATVSGVPTAVWTSGSRMLTGIGSSGIASQSSVDALPTAIAALDISGLTDLKTLGGALTGIRRFTTWTPATPNAKVYNQSTGRVDVTADDGTTILYQVPVHDDAGNAVQPQAGDPWKVGA